MNESLENSNFPMEFPPERCHAMIRMDVLFSSKSDANSLFFRFMELSLRKKAIIYETDIYGNIRLGQSLHGIIPA